jgi:hypothetical protein
MIYTLSSYCGLILSCIVHVPIPISHLSHTIGVKKSVLALVDSHWVSERKSMIAFG